MRSAEKKNMFLVTGPLNPFFFFFWRRSYADEKLSDELELGNTYSVDKLRP